MEKISREEYESLIPVEKHLETAYKGNWKRNTLPEEDELVKKVLTSHSPGYVFNSGCPVCMLNAYVLVGEWYFYYKENIKQTPKRRKKDE